MITPRTRVLVRCPNWIGDAVMALPALNSLCAAGYEVCAAIHRDFIPVVQWGSCVSGTLPLDEKKDYLNISHYARAAGAFDAAVLFTNSFSSAFASYFAKARFRIGFSNGARNLFLTHPVKASKTKAHHIERYKLAADECIKLIGADDLEAGAAEKARAFQTSKPRLECPAHIIEKVRCLFGNIKTPRIIGIASGAAYGSAKVWPPGHFAALCEQLLEDPQTGIVVLGTSHVPQISAVLKEKKYQGKAVDLTLKTSLSELIGVLSVLDLVVCNDSGIMHLAAALCRPVVALFGSTDPELTGPLYSDKAVVMKKDIPCAPCFKRTCRRRTYECLTGISVQDVYTAVMERISGNSQ